MDNREIVGVFQNAQSFHDARDCRSQAAWRAGCAWSRHCADAGGLNA
jgi:hypothetical protein